MDIIDIIGTIVDNIRETASITNIVDNANGTYTITANPKTLANGDYVTIADTVGFNDSNYKISTVTSTTFNITKTAGTSIPGSFGTWKANAPYYDYDYWTEETRILMDKGRSSTYKFQMFDLIFLLIPTKEIKNRNYTNKMVIIPNLNLYFFTETKGDKNTKWRKENIKPTLDTLEQKFIAEFQKIVFDELEVEQTWIPFMDGTAEVMTTPVDALYDSITNITVNEPCR